LPWRHEGSSGGLEYGSAAFDVTKWVAVGGMIVMAHVQLIQPIVAISGSIGHARRLDPSPVQADLPTSVRTVPPTESHTLLHQTSNLAPVSIGDEMQHIFNQLSPSELADSGTGW
jgi:hypothetical protein